MHQTVETILALLVLTTVLAVVAKKVQVPYPIFLVLGGAGLAFIPGLPVVSLDPQLVFLFFLPPLLYAGGYFTSWRDFRANIVSISLLAVGLVLATTTVVAVAVHAIVPGIPWPVAFVLGAIVSPPDAIAAATIAQRLKLPRQLITILEGESLVNDSTGLVLLKFATVAVVSGTFSPSKAAGEFVLVSVGGVAAGLVVGWLFAKIERIFDDSVLAATASILVAFLTYILAERLQVSGVLAVVTAGLVQGRYVPTIWTARIRVEGLAVWQTVVFILNALIFVLIGLQLPSVVRGLTWPRSTLVDAAFATCAAMIGVRLVWMFPGAYVPRFLFPKLRAKNPYPPWQAVVIAGWTGMRGVVSLAAALSLPVATAGGAPFPARDLIIFLTFTAILATLVLQGLTLPPLIRWLAVGEDKTPEREEQHARVEIAKAGVARVDALTEERVLPAHQVHPVRQELVDRLRQLTRTDARGPESSSDVMQQIRREAIAAQREQLVELRNREVIGDDVLHRIQHELDIEEMRLP